MDLTMLIGQIEIAMWHVLKELPVQVIEPQIAFVASEKPEFA